MRKTMRDKAIIVDEIHRQARKNFLRRHVKQISINDTLEVDLVDMQKYARFNKNFKYLLTCIDIFSKKGYARPLKNKQGIEVTKAMESIIEEIGDPPKNIHSDQGKELFNKDFKRLMNKHGINHFFTYTLIKGAIVERFNRTIKSWMWKLFSLNGSYEWISLLNNLLNKYNNHYHRTIKLAPNEVNKSNEKQILHTCYRYPNVYKRPKFKFEDHVRITKYKGVFSKGYEPNWSTEIFKIAKVHFTSPVTYILKDYEGNIIAGGFYEQELQIAKTPNVYLVEKVLKERDGKLFVKFLGFDKTHNQWIDKRSISD